MILEKLLYTQLVKFIVVGVSNTVISYIVFYIFYNLFLDNNAFLSQCISYAAGIIWSFIWNRKWTFSEQKSHWVVVYPFIISQTILLFLSASMLEYATSNLDWNINLIWICVMLIITAINFIVMKFGIFKV